MGRKRVDLVTVLGPTAGGKTRFAACLSERIGGEIISADSRQVYRKMDIGTGKDLKEYLVNGKEVPVHLVDIADAGFEYNLFLFRRDFQTVFTDIKDRGHVPVMCGGTGMYIESILRGYRIDPVPVNHDLREDLGKKSFEELIGMLKLYGPLHNVTDTVNRERLTRAIEIAIYQGTRTDPLPEERKLFFLTLGIRHERMIRRRRITERLKMRLENGLIEEVEELLKQGVTPEKLEYYGLEYRYVTRYIRKQITYDEMFSGLNTAIHQYAKRQMTYFTGMERRGVKIHWLDGAQSMEDKLKEALRIYGSAMDSGPVP